MLQYKNLNWLEITKKVWSLQNKIAVAYLNEDFVETKRLQRELVRSFEARALAVRKVTTNQGTNTLGIDNILSDTGALKMEAIKKLKELQGYKSFLVKWAFILKENSIKLRPFGIPTIFDRTV